MKKVLFSMVAFACLAVSCGMAAAADNFKMSGIEMHAVAVQAVPASQASGSMADRAQVATVADSVNVASNAAMTVQAYRSPVERAAVAADVRPDMAYQLIGIRADREVGARSAPFRI